MTEPPRPDSKYHFTDLDGVRGVLAFTVMLYHLGLNSVLQKFTEISEANWGACVDFFFVLSGFVICKSVSGKPVSVGRFAWKRFWRLFPLHLAIFILFSWTLFPPGTSLGSVLLSAAAIAPFLQQPSFNFPAWSMGFEFYIPILFVAIISRHQLSQKAVLAIAAILLLISVVASQQLLSHDDRIFGGYLDLIRALTGLGLGFVAWKLFETGRFGSFRRCNNLVFLLIVLGFFVLVIASAKIAILGIFLPVLNLAAMFVGAKAKTFFSSRLFQWGGKLSFGIYMLHAPVLYSFTAIFGLEKLDGSIPLKAAIIVTSVVLAQILHLLVEQPGMRIGAGGRWRHRVAQT